MLGLYTTLFLEIFELSVREKFAMSSVGTGVPICLSEDIMVCLSEPGTR